MPKVKTNHWSRVTLSMKNMFGIVPGCRYGWPKNILHWAGIHGCILDICATIRPHFVIADGIVAMDGDGPLNGSAKALQTILLADDLVAADSNLARLLNIEPNNVKFGVRPWYANRDSYDEPSRSRRMACLNASIAST